MPSPNAAPALTPAPEPPTALRFVPRPVSGIAIDLGDGRTAATLVWDGDDYRRCRLCPEGRCGATRTPSGDATCTRILPGVLTAAEAAAFEIR